MIRAIVLVLGLSLATEAHAQAIYTLSTASLDIAAPREAEYDAGASDASDNFFIITTCTGSRSHGCRLFLQYGSNPQGQQVGMEYALVTAGADCEGVSANPNAWLPVQPTAVVLSTRKNRICTATFRFRVRPISYATYTSPGPVGGAYLQRVNFLLTRP